MTVADEKHEREGLHTRRRSLSFIGVVLMVSSLPLWPALLVVPFLPMETTTKGMVATGIIIVAEIAFWLGFALAGPSAVRRMKSWWRSKRRKKPE
jgi:hypothetical protein